MHAQGIPIPRCSGLQSCWNALARETMYVQAPHAACRCMCTTEPWPSPLLPSFSPAHRRPQRDPNSSALSAGSPPTRPCWLPTARAASRSCASPPSAVPASACRGLLFAACSCLFRSKKCLDHRPSCELLLRGGGLSPAIYTGWKE